MIPIAQFFLDTFVQYKKYEQYYYYCRKGIKFSEHTILVQTFEKKVMIKYFRKNDESIFSTQSILWYQFRGKILP